MKSNIQNMEFSPSSSERKPSRHFAADAATEPDEHKAQQEPLHRIFAYIFRVIQGGFARILIQLRSEYLFSKTYVYRLQSKAL